MAFQLGNKKGPISEINITPFVDIVLVLLIIFMITAPLMYNGIKLKLPKTKKVNSLNLSNEQTILSYSLSGEYYFGQNKVLQTELINLIRQKFKDNKSEILYLRAHYKLPYGKVAKLMALLKSQGISQIALVTEVDRNSK
jgi:biopolymer transport protein TolR